jgi:hypothetical protein
VCETKLSQGTANKNRRRKKQKREKKGERDREEKREEKKRKGEELIERERFRFGKSRQERIDKEQRACVTYSSLPSYVYMSLPCVGPCDRPSTSSLPPSLPPSRETDIHLHIHFFKERRGTCAISTTSTRRKTLTISSPFRKKTHFVDIRMHKKEGKKENKTLGKED